MKQATLSRLLPDTAAWLSALPVGVLVARGDDIVYCNPEAEELIGTARTLSAMGLFELAKRAPVIAHDIPPHHLTAYFSHGAEPGEVLIVLAASPHAQPHLQHAQREEELQRYGLMTAMLAHEVKNPLTGIRGAAQLLRKQLPADQQPMAQLICDEVDRITGVLARIEPFSGTGALSAEPLNIHEVLHYVQSLAKAGVAQHVTFRERYDPSLPSVLASRETLVQVLLNLIKNAAEATRDTPDATITLHTAYSYDAKLPVAVTVEDNGPGFSPDMAANPFKPLHSTKGEGRGLGLSIAAKLTADNGGVLSLISSHPGCTKLQLLLPAPSSLSS